jgi:lipopolysaccharide/colanic/teichoic acid biosynthesis glycosyltransferase
MDTAVEKAGLSPGNALLKRGFDLLLATLGLCATFWLIAVAWLLSTIDTRRNGFFTQVRVGREGRHFKVFKIRTMRDSEILNTTVTASTDPRITSLGRFLRKTKIDELPQLINVLRGQMSFVGPRPDVPGYADCLEQEDRIILTIRPGITGPASLKYREEERMLAERDDPERYNRDVIFPDKVRINKEYIQNYSLWKDIIYIWETLTG